MPDPTAGAPGASGSTLGSTLGSTPGSAGTAVAAGPAPSSVLVRRARATDVRAVRALTAPLAERGVLVAKHAVASYESVPEMRVAELDGAVVGCGALHVMWEDLAEVRTLAVASSARGLGVGSALVEALLDDARETGVSRVFCLTFEVPFFARLGFEVIEGTPVAPEVYAELLRSHDDGVAEFLDLARVKPNTLGNTRMLLHLR